MSRSNLSLSANPVRLARRSRGKTIKKIAEDAGINEHAWYLTECGCYRRIPPTIVKYLDNLGIKIDQEAYDEFREEAQRQFGKDFFSNYILPPPSTKTPPLLAFIDANAIVNLTFFSKAMCIQPSLLYRISRGKARELPLAVRQALLTAGISEDDVYELNERTIEYYESCHAVN